MLKNCKTASFGFLALILFDFILTFYCLHIGKKIGKNYQPKNYQPKKYEQKNVHQQFLGKSFLVGGVGGMPLAVTQEDCLVFRWFKFTLKPPIVVAIGNL